MKPQHILLVKHSFRAVALQHDRLAGFFLAELFARDPRLWRLFRAEPGLRPARLYEALASIVDAIDRLHPIVPVLEWVAVQGARRHVAEPHYDSIGEAWLAALEAALGDAFTEAHAEAWAEAYRAVVAVMSRALASEPLAA